MEETKVESENLEEGEVIEKDEKKAEEEEDKVERGIRKQQPYDPRAIARETTQTYAYNGVVGRLNSVMADLKRSQDDNAFLRSKVVMLQHCEQQASDLLEEKHDLLSKQRELLKEKEVREAMLEEYLLHCYYCYHDDALVLCLMD